MKPTKHSYDTDGTNKGHVDVEVLRPGETYDYGEGKGKIRVTAPFVNSFPMNDSNSGGYRAMPAGDVAKHERKMPGKE